MQTLFIVTNNSRAVMIDIIVKVFERSHPCQTKFRWTEHAQMCGQASKMAQKCLQTCLNPLKTKGHHSASVHIEQMGFAAQACRWQSLQMQAWGNESGNKPSTEQLSSCFTEHRKQQHQSPWNWQLDLVQPFLLWSPFKIDLGNVNFGHICESMKAEQTLKPNADQTESTRMITSILVLLVRWSKREHRSWMQVMLWTWLLTKDDDLWCPLNILSYQDCAWELGCQERAAVGRSIHYQNGVRNIPEAPVHSLWAKYASTTRWAADDAWAPGTQTESVPNTLMQLVEPLLVRKRVM